MRAGLRVHVGVILGGVDVRIEAQKVHGVQYC